MKLKKFLNVMKPTRTYKVIYNRTVTEFKPNETLPDIIASAELIRSIKDKETGCVVFEIKSEEEEYENY